MDFGIATNVFRLISRTMRSVTRGVSGRVTSSIVATRSARFGSDTNVMSRVLNCGSSLRAIAANCWADGYMCFPSTNRIMPQLRTCDDLDAQPSRSAMAATYERARKKTA